MTALRNVEAETYVLGALLVDNEALAEVRDLVSAEDFTSPMHCNAFAEVERLVGENAVADELTLSRALGANLEIFSAWVDACPSVATIRRHAEQVAMASRLRKLVSACDEIARDAKESRITSETEALGFFADAQQRLADLTTYGTSQHVHAGEVMRSTMRLADERSRTRGQLPGVSTGFEQLDSLLLGLRRKHLVIVGAKTGVGKTAFALNLTANAARNGARSFVCSYEMGTDELGLRMLSSEARVPAMRIEMGTLEANDFARLARGAESFGNSPIVFTDRPPRTIPELRAECQSLKRKGGLQLVVIDYLQLMESATKTYSREREVAEISRGLKKIAMELDVCVVALSQLNRKQDRHEEPTLADLRDSGSIEQDANSVVFLWTDADDSPTVRFRVAKNRGASVGGGEFAFKRPIVRFEPV